MIITEAFIDESGTHDGSPAMTVAGYLFRQDQARRFSRDWKKVLDANGLTAAHQTDCALGFGEYKGMPKPKRVEIQRKLIENIKRRTLFGFGVSVDPDAYKRIVGKENNAPSCYSFALMGVFTTMSRWARETAFNGQIGYVFEAGHSSQNEAGRFISALLSSERSRFRDAYSGHEFLDKKVARELQAADMLAWQYHHSLVRQRQGFERPRKDFTALLRPQDRCINHTDETLSRFRRDIIDEGWLIDRY